jgi:hypothetical protein
MLPRLHGNENDAQSWTHFQVSEAEEDGVRMIPEETLQLQLRFEHLTW